MIKIDLDRLYYEDSEDENSLLYDDEYNDEYNYIEPSIILSRSSSSSSSSFLFSSKTSTLSEEMTQRSNIFSNLQNMQLEGKTKAMLEFEMLNIKRVKQLILMGCAIKAKDNYGWTLLHYSCNYKNSDDVTKMLIESNADLNAQEYIGGNTPLMLAHFNRFTNKIKMLTEAGADVNVQNNNGNTLLMRIVLGIKLNDNIRDLTTDHSIISYLIQNKADINVRNNKGNTALILASQHNPYMIQALRKIENIDKDIRNHDNLTAAEIYKLRCNR